MQSSHIVNFTYTGNFMGQHYLSPLFSPRSVAVIGASNRLESVGGVVFKNMLESGYQGNLYPVNPGQPEIQGHRAYASIDEIDTAVDLAVIATKAAAIPAIIEACGKQGVRAAVILSAGFSEAGPEGIALERAVVENARRYGVRLIGPNCLGIMRPSVGLNATFSNGGAKSGRLALISQSGALCTAILDWAQPNDVGFSSIISMGATADVDFGEILDYLVSDPQTESILLYIEGIHHARSFMSALRAASRFKPVILVKVGRHEAGSKAAFSHTGALVGADDVFDAALRRAGVVRVDTIVQLFSAAKALSARFHPAGNRLAIVTNGGGPGVMASDRAADLGVNLATLSPSTIDELNKVLPATWSHGNPVDIIGDATAERYRDAVTLCMQDAGVDGVLTILTPQAMTHPLQAAEAVIAVAKQFNKPLVACWMGEGQVAASRLAFAQAQIPSFRTPEPAVEIFSFIAAYYQNQKLLMQTPGPLAQHRPADVEGARLLIEGALAEHRTVLNEMESKAILATFQIPIAKTVVARSPNEALILAEELGLPVVMKINSPDISHKSDSGGIRLNLGNAEAVRAAYHEIIQAVQLNRPNARIDGVVIEPMAVKPNGRELMLGVTTDPVFGPVITFSAGGIMVEVMGDRAVALPPLNGYLVHDMIARTRVAKLLGAFRHMPPVDMEALESVLLRVSEMVCELPWIKEMDINPLIIDENGVVAVDARIVVGFPTPSAQRYAHMAIHPYPTNLISHWQLPDGEDIIIRPISPEDAELEQIFVRGLSEEAKYFRFMDTLQELTQNMLVRFTQIDYDREMALIAVLQQDGLEIELGVCRYITNPDGLSCEFALVIADEWQHKGIGLKLMTSLMHVAASKGLRLMEGEVLGTNHAMLALVERLGFSVTTSPDDGAIKRVVKTL
jgi:acetyltransferase